MTKVLRHIVAFKFTDETTEAQIGEIAEAFANLEDQIDEVIGFEGGADNSPEQLQNGFTHVFTITFADEAGRATYLPHPAHKAFTDKAGPHIDKVLVLDYWA